jgi:predicted RNA-binding protein YlqC (UPF0109 family)
MPAQAEHRRRLTLQSNDAFCDEFEQVVRTMATWLVDRPQEIEVEVQGGNLAVVAALTVATEDVGKILGKRGETADAIRRILKAGGGKRGKRLELEVRDAAKVGGGSR